MMHSDSVGDLMAALALAQPKVRGAAKDSTNPHLRNKYADLAATWAACREALAEHGLSVTQLPTVLDNGTEVLDTVLAHASGQWIASRIRLVYGDEKGLKPMQAMGSALSYARRYGLAAIVGVCPEDDDGESSYQRPAQRHHDERAEDSPANGHAPSGGGPSNSRYGDPTNAKQLLGWAFSAEKEHGLALVQWLDNEVKLAELPRGKWTDWPEDVQREWVPKFYAKAVAKVNEVIAARSADKQANGQAADFTLANQRKKLKSLILHRACQVTRKATATELTEAERFAALAECDNVRAGSGGAILSGRIDDCTDPALLAAYIEIAEGVVEVGSM